MAMAIAETGFYLLNRRGVHDPEVPNSWAVEIGAILRPFHDCFAGEQIISQLEDDYQGDHVPCKGAFPLNMMLGYTQVGT